MACDPTSDLMKDAKLFSRWSILGAISCLLGFVAVFVIIIPYAIFHIGANLCR
jgi:uncharacterized membrane protein YbaN (DUF454 family)